MSSPARPRRRLLAVLVSTAALVGGLSILGPVGSAQAAGPAPCDIYASSGNACVAAFSSTRALFAGYAGPLYQVRRASDGATRDIPVTAAGGYANAAAQDAFCSGTSCTIPTIYDQTANRNNLTVFPRLSDGQQGTNNSPADAAAVPVTVNGNKAYGVFMPPRVSYRRAAVDTRGTARGANPETIYMVASGTNVNNSCCSDFGNVEARQTDDNAGTMDTVNLSTLNGTFRGTRSYGYGPWVQNDLENGVFQGQSGVNTNNHGNPTEFVTAMSRNNGLNRYSLKGADATNGTAATSMSTWYDGGLPTAAQIGPAGQSYSPMRLEGSIVLGAGGDNSNAGTSTFFEGVMTGGFSSDAADNQVQANIAAQHYDGANSGGGPGSTITHAGKCIDVAGFDKGGNNAKVDISDCETRAADQHWEGSAYGIHTLGTMSRCMDAAGNGTANGTPVILYDCNPAVQGQQWIIRPDGTIFNPHSGRCLDDPSNNTTNGTQLQLYDCSTNAAQQFNVTTGVPLLPGVQGSTASPDDGTQNCVDVDGNDLGIQRPVQTFTCRTIVTQNPEAQDQKWTYNRATQKLMTEGLCLDINNNGTGNGNPLEVFTCNQAQGQIFQFQPDGASYRLFNPQSGKCVDIDQGVHSARVLQIYTCIGGDAQHFTLN